MDPPVWDADFALHEEIDRLPEHYRSALVLAPEKIEYIGVEMATPKQ
jgi:hypothetical protein